MTSPARQFPFIARDPTLGSASLAPMLPVVLTGSRAVECLALLDTGAAVNVIPFDVGQQLGLRWDDHHTSVRLSGNLAKVEARVAIVTATVADLPPARLAMAWARQDGIPVLLGQTNFFMEFDVCFFRSRGKFDIRPRAAT